MHVSGSNELVADVFNRELCIGCGACVNLCPYYRNYRGKTVRLFGCDLSRGRCYAYCPKAEVNLDELSGRIWHRPYDGSPLGYYRQIVAARAGAQMPRRPFQGGGTVSALMTLALKEDMIEAAALTDRQGLNPVAELVTGWREVVNYAGSKFMAAPTLAALNAAVRENYTRVGVVATPCQLTAVAQMHTDPLTADEVSDPVALSVGLFCNWSLDARRLALYFQGILDTYEIRHMDVPPPPADSLVLETGDGRVEIPLAEIRPLIPSTCFICPDMSSELSDVSVGMFEGRSGWNTLVIRSARGAELVRRACAGGYLETGEMPPENVAHLISAAAEKKTRAVRTLIRRKLINTGNAERSALRMPPAIVDKILNFSSDERGLG